VDPAELWVDIVDPNVQQIEWYVDDALVPGAAGETFSLLDYGYGPGLYSVYSYIFDPTDWVRVGREAMEQYASWTVELTPEPASLWLCGIGAGVLLRRRRRPASATRR
jgi:hypothetical protein